MFTATTSTYGFSFDAAFQLSPALADFKVALCLPVGTAQKLGSELLKTAERNKAKQQSSKAKQSPPTPAA